MIEAAPKQDEAAPPRVVGLVADSAHAYVERRGALAIAFEATRDGATRVRDWLESVCAIEGCSAKEARSLTDTLLRQLGLPVASTPMIGSLSPVHRVALALAEAAIATWAQRASVVVVPAPPLPWPARNDARRLALDLFAGVDVVLHAREAWELAQLVRPDALVDERDRPLVHAGARAIVARVYGSGEPYAAWLAALEALSVIVDGGPISHVLRAPEGVSVREILAAAHDANLDLLEVRELLDRP